MNRTIQEITSRENPRFHTWFSLLVRKGRRKEGLFLIEGRRTLNAALNARVYPSALIFRKDAILTPAEAAEIDRPECNKAQLFSLPPHLFNELSAKDSPQGVLAVVPIPGNPDWREHRWKWVSVLAENIQDPRNLGMLIRTLDAAGAEALFIGENSVDLCHPTTVASSMGSIFNFPIFRDVRPLEAVEKAGRDGVLIAASSGSGSTDAIPWARTMRPPAMLLLGNEGGGLSRDLTKKADVVVSLPIFGNAESLNVAVAAGVLLYMMRTDSPPKCSGACRAK